MEQEALLLQQQSENSDGRQGIDDVLSFSVNMPLINARLVSVIIHWFPAPCPLVHRGTGKGWPLITTFDSDTNTISIDLIALYNNVQSSVNA